jgi:NADH-quinone oxidoreductase subunit H
MRLGWKVFVPLCLLWIFVIGVWMMSPFNVFK